MVRSFALSRYNHRAVIITLNASSFPKWQPDFLMFRSRKFINNFIFSNKNKPQGVIRLSARLTSTLKFFIQENLDTEWKFTRTKIWLSWIYKKGVLPPPFNILYVLLPVHWLIKHLLAACLPGHFVSNSLYMHRDFKMGCIAERRFLGNHFQCQ